jgi:hypothetical protein
MHTVLATVVVAPTWYAVFGAPLSHGSETGESAARAQYILSSVALLLACVLTCFIAYDLERAFRVQYLSDTRFLSITRNLQSQLDGLERSLLAAAGKSDLTPADLDSPLEKAMLAVRSLILDESLGGRHKAILELVMACLSSPDLLTPDLDLQVQQGQVEIDDEQEKWLFYEVARRKEVKVGGVSGASVAHDESGEMILPVSVDVDVQKDGEDFPGSVVIHTDADSVVARAAEPAVLAASSVSDNVVATASSSAMTSAATTSVMAASGFTLGQPVTGGLVELRRGSASSSGLTPTRYISAAELTNLLTPQTVILLTRIPEYNFPIFDFAEATMGRPLLVMAYHLCVNQSGLVGKLGLSVEKFLNGMATLEGGYHADLACKLSMCLDYS